MAKYLKNGVGSFFINKYCRLLYCGGQVSMDTWFQNRFPEFLLLKTHRVVDKPDCVVMLLIDNGFIHLVQQYRYAVKRWCWEIPQGAWESKKLDSEEEDLIIQSFPLEAFEQMIIEEQIKDSVTALRFGKAERAGVASTKSSEH